ncbi:hypothetical protein ACFL5D_02175 [Candidatus Neomarinimicrobiota bacterium]
MVKHITYMWQLGFGTGIFWFQTDDPQIADKLRRANNWKPILIYCNKPRWIFEKSFHIPQDARKKLQSLCKVSKLKKGSDKGEFYAETYANKTKKN